MRRRREVPRPGRRRFDPPRLGKRWVGVGFLQFEKSGVGRMSVPDVERWSYDEAERCGVRS